MRTTRTVGFIALCLLVSAFALTGVTFAHGGGGGGSETRIRAVLDPCGGTPCNPATPVEPGAEGKAERRLRTGKSVRDEFRVTVEIPEINALGIDATNAATADIRATFNDGTIDYAECSLVFAEFDPIDMVFEFKVDRRVRNGVLKKGVGTCIDLTGTGAGLTTGDIPVAADGDMVTVRLINIPDINFLEGVFAPE